MFPLKKLALLAIVPLVLSFVLAFGPHIAEALAPRFTQFLPPALLAEVLLMIGCLMELWRKGALRLSRRDVGLAAGVGLALTTAIALAIPAEFRILADETNLISTSLGLFKSARADNITMAETYYDMFHIVGWEVATRPLLFPGLMAVLHWLFGYSAYHGFQVNFACMATALTCMVLIGRQLGSRALGVFAAVMMAALPMFQLYGRASGFEPVNLAVLAGLMLAMIAFAQKPTFLRFECALWLGLLAGQCRYESIVMIAPIMALGVVHHRRLAGTRASWRLLLIPLCLVPLVWQREATSVINAGDTISAPFGPQYLWPHLQSAAAYFFDPEPGKYPVVQMISVLSVLGFATVLWELIERWRRPAPAEPTGEAIDETPGSSAKVSAGEHQSLSSLARISAQTSALPATGMDGAVAQSLAYEASEEALLMQGEAVSLGLSPWFEGFSKFIATPATKRWSVTTAMAFYSFGILVIFATHLAYYLADFRTPIIGRYALSYLVPLSLLAAFPLAEAWNRREFRLWAAALAIGAYCYGISVSATNDYGRQLLLFREYRDHLAFLEKYPTDATLLVSDRPGMYAAHLYGSVSFDYFKRNRDSYIQNYSRHLYQHVFIIQQVRYNDMVGTPKVDARLRLKTVHQYQNSGDYYVRIAEVVGVDPERGPPLLPLE